MTNCGCDLQVESKAQARVLWIVLGINATMFCAELAAGLFANSTALIADSFDMLADAVVYAVALKAVFGSVNKQASAARLSASLQMLLGLMVFGDATRQLLAGSAPEGVVMIWASVVALIANAACLKLISAHKDEGAHMRASQIFSQNDVIANCAVITSGLLVLSSGWQGWDLLAGLGIGILLFRGGLRIRRELRAATTTVEAQDRLSSPPVQRVE